MRSGRAGSGPSGCTTHSATRLPATLDHWAPDTAGPGRASPWASERGPRGRGGRDRPRRARRSAVPLGGPCRRGTWWAGSSTARTISSRDARSTPSTARSLADRFPDDPAARAAIGRGRAADASGRAPDGRSRTHGAISGTASSSPPPRADRRARAGARRRGFPAGAAPSASTSPGTRMPIPSPGHRIRVEVLNGTSRPGLARTATRRSGSKGSTWCSSGPGPSADSTRIFVRRGDPGQGRDVAEALGVGGW